MSESLDDLKEQAARLQEFVEWAGMNKVNIKETAEKSAISAYKPSYIKGKGDTKFKDQLRTVKYMGRSFPVLLPHQSYKYLGVRICTNLDWSEHKREVTNQISERCSDISNSYCTVLQKQYMLRSVVKSIARYAMIPIPFSVQEVTAMDAVIWKTYRKCASMHPRNFKNSTIQAPTHQSGCGMQSLMADYVTYALKIVSNKTCLIQAK